MATDPLLNERALLAALRSPVDDLTSNDMRSLSALVLMACYDRKVAREFMAEVIDLTVGSISQNLSRMEKAGAFKYLHTGLKPDEPTPILDEECDKLVKTFMGLKKALGDKLDLVSQCPTTEDKIS